MICNQRQSQMQFILEPTLSIAHAADIEALFSLIIPSAPTIALAGTTSFIVSSEKAMSSSIDVVSLTLIQTKGAAITKLPANRPQLVPNSRI